MVMHARKYPRLSDGFYERGQTHPGEAKAASKSRSSQYSDHYIEKSRDSPGYNCRRGEESASSHTSSPRYQNKSSYKEKANNASRTKSAGGSSSSSNGGVAKDTSRSREQRERDHRAEVQRSAVHQCGDWTEHRSSSGKRYYYNCKTEQSQWEKPKEWVDPPHRVKEKEVAKERSAKPLENRHSHSSFNAEKHRSNMRSSGSSSSHTAGASHSSRSAYNSSSASQCLPKDKQHRQYNSSGHEERLSLDSRISRELQETTLGSSLKRLASQQSREDRATPSSTPHHHSGTNGLPAPHRGDTPTRAPANPAAADHSVRNSSRHPSSSLHDMYSRQCDTNDASRGAAMAEDMDISPAGSTPTEESMMERGMASLLPSSSSPRLTLPSPSMVPPPLTPTSRPLPQQLPLTPGAPARNSVLNSIMSLPNMSSGEAREALQKIESQQITQQAIQTLKKIQQALLAEQQQQQRQLLQFLLQQLQTQIEQQKKQPHSTSTPATAATTSASAAVIPRKPRPADHHHRNSTSDRLSSTDGKAIEDDQSPYSPPDSDGTPLQSPEYAHPSQQAPVVHPRLQEDGLLERSGGRESSPHSEHSGRSLPSASPGGPASVVVAPLMAAAQRKPEPGLTPSLANYVNPSLMEHVAGWLVDPVELQANKCAEEAHTIGSIGCAQVSGELKQARSLVRITEIEATLNEQRVLFLRQQIKDLEGIRSQSPFVSSASSAAAPVSSFKVTPASSSLSSSTMLSSSSPSVPHPSVAPALS